MSGLYKCVAELARLSGLGIGWQAVGTKEIGQSQRWACQQGIGPGAVAGTGQYDLMIFRSLNERENILLCQQREVRRNRKQPIQRCQVLISIIQAGVCQRTRCAIRNQWSVCALLASCTCENCLRGLLERWIVSLLRFKIGRASCREKV